MVHEIVIVPVVALVMTNEVYMSKKPGPVNAHMVLDLVQCLCFSALAQMEDAGMECDFGDLTHFVAHHAMFLFAKSCWWRCKCMVFILLDFFNMMMGSTTTEELWIAGLGLKELESWQARCSAQSREGSKTCSVEPSNEQWILRHMILTWIHIISLVCHNSIHGSAIHYKVLAPTRKPRRCHMVQSDAYCLLKQWHETQSVPIRFATRTCGLNQALEK